MTSGRINHLFTSFIWIIFLNTICDFITGAPEDIIGNIYNNRTIMYLCSSLYFVFRTLTPVIYISFIGNTVGNWSKFRKNKVFWGLYIIPYTIVPVLILINTFKPIIFYFDADNNYNRGKYLIILYIIANYYMLLGFIYLYKIRKILSKDKLFAMFSLYGINIIAAIVQFLYPKLLIEMFSMTIAALLITMFILRAEETIDIYSDANSYNDFCSKLKNYTDAKMPISIIFIKIKNSTSLVNLLGNDTFNHLIKTLSNKIKPEYESNTDILSIVSANGYSQQLYYLLNGTYACIFEGNYSEKEVSAERERIFKIANTNVNINSVNLPLDICVCEIKFPDEFKSYEEVMDFSATFDKNIIGSGSYSFSELNKDQQHIIKENIDTVISDALKKNKFEMYYQPIYDTKKGKFTTCEALIRLHDSDHLIPPSIFIPVAEKSGAIYNIGDFVLNSTFKSYSEEKMNDLGIEFLEINLSAMQCMKDDLISKVQILSKTYHVPTNCINFEITETATDYIQDIVTRNLKKIKELGYDISLDDYGTGYSNLMRMTCFPFTIVKLDKNFVNRIDTANMQTVMKNTINMMKELGLKIVVEGVEDEATAKWFIDNNCDYIQGFLYARPMPISDLIEFLKTNN